MSIRPNSNRKFSIPLRVLIIGIALLVYVLTGKILVEQPEVPKAP